MISQVALGRLVVIASIVAACVSEPEGIRRTDASNQGDEPATAGQPSDGAPSRARCEELELVRAKCARCHASPPRHGAPFSLSSAEDILHLDHKGLSRRERMAEAVERADMPPAFLELEPPVEQLSDEERDALLAWLRGDEEAIARCD
jgi:mono/diheme cytochrome c family protein